MAELNASEKSGRRRSVSRMSPRIDLTAMVDLAFLLITFFIMATTLAKPKAMDTFWPDKSKKDVQLPVPESRTMTVLLGNNHSIEWYIGAPGKSAPTVDHFTKTGIRKS